MKKLKTLAKTVVRTMRKSIHRFDTWLRRVVLWPFRKLWKFKKLRKHILPIAKFARNHHRVTAGLFASVMLLGVAIPVWQDYLHAQRYVLSSSVQKLVGEANENITSKIEYNPKTAAYEFNASSKLPLDVEGNPIPSMVAQAGGGDADAEQQYSVDVARSLKDGVTYHENNMGLSFTLTPQFAALSGEKVEGGRLLYPLADGLGGQLIYTATHQGLKEDVVLHTKPKTNEVILSYSVALPESLDIKLLDTGEIGVYSADPALYGSIQYGSSDDKEKVEAIRNGADKTYLAFTVPAPYVVGLDEQGSQIRMPLSSRFVLSSDKKTLSVITNGFDKTEAKDYPLSIDPSVTVTSTTDFTENGNDEDGNLTYGSGEVSRSQLSGGRYAAWSTTTAFPASTRDAKLIAYNNFMYGFKETGGFYELFRTSINSNGTLGGSWTKETNQPTEHNRFSESVVYNGYLYILGGEGAPNKVEYAKINADGTVGVWRETSALSTGRQDFGTATYNGYIYVIGNGSSYTDVVEYAAISANGSLGAWQTTSVLPAAIGFNGAAASNGYLYSIGSASGGIYYAKINDNGSVGAWMTTSSPASGVFMDEGETFVYRGYLYIIGGYGNGSDTNGQSKYAQINADGSIGQWVDGPALGTGGRLVHLGATAYNGYIYAAGGALTNANGTPQSTVRYAQIGTAGDVSKWTVATPVPTARREAAVVVYGGYLYQMGGANATTTAYNTIQYTALTSTGSWGSWTTNSTNLPTTMRSFTAFAYKGYMYAIGGTNGAASTYSAGVYRATINSNGSLSSFSTSGQTQLTTPGGRYDHATVVYNDYVYVLGGRTGASAYAGTVHYAHIDASGNIGAWTNASNTFSTARAGHTAIQYGGYLYILGGWNGTTRYSDVQYAKINSNGSLTAWSSTESLFGSEALVNHATVAANGYLYTTGGQSNSGVVSRTAKARINTDGSLATWEQVADIDSSGVSRTEHQNVYYQGAIYNLGGTNGSSVQSSVIWARVHNGGMGAPKAAWQTTTTDFVERSRLRSVAYDGYLYTVGGVSFNGSNSIYHDDVKYAKINDNGSLGTWQTATSLSVGRASPGVFVKDGKLYVVGGTGDGSNYLTSSEYAAINPDGSLGSWQSTTSMPAGRRNFSSVQFGEYFYILGGRDGASGTYLTSVSYVKINSDGSFGSWQTTSSFSGARRAASVVATGGYMYILGGDNSGDAYGDVQYARINGDGTLGTWGYTSSFSSIDEDLTGVVAVAYNGHIYLTGGKDDTSDTTNDIKQAELTASGALGEWTKSSTFGDSVADRFDHDAVAYGGYLYLLSGEDYGGYTDTVEYSSLDVQSRSATYSKVINLGAFSAVNSIEYTGDFGAGTPHVTYRTAGASGEFGASRLYSDVDGGSSVDVCVAAANAAQKYAMVTVTINDNANALFGDGVANNASSLGSITIDYDPPVRAPTELRMRSGKWFYDDTLRPMDVCGQVVVTAPEEPEEKVMPQYVGWSANGTTGGTSLSVPVPSNSRGYTAVIAGEFANNEATINAPAGWQLVTSIGIANAVVTSTKDKVFVYVATSETPGSNWAWTNGSAHVTVGITGYSVPVEVASSASARTTQTAPSITTSVPDALIMRMVADLSDNDASMSYPSSATLGRNQRRDFLSGFGASIVGVAYSELAAAGSTGTATFGISGSWFPVAATLALVQAD